MLISTISWFIENTCAQQIKFRQKNNKYRLPTFLKDIIGVGNGGRSE